jgi:biopolymer transport protein ExbD
VITVHTDRTIQINQEERIEVANLEERLKLLFKNAPHHVVFVRGGKDLDFGQVAEVIDHRQGAPGWIEWR